MIKSAWGNFPRVQTNIINIETVEQLSIITNSTNNIIPSGNYRSYGDSALSKYTINLKKLNKFLFFDKKCGVIICESGVLLEEIINIILPHGWFLSVVPGTQLITIGGAIASDVHGKNHHQQGCFSEFVQSFDLMLPDGIIVNCTKEHELFRATCGGMGLTGTILQATIQLKKIHSKNIKQTTIKAKNIYEMFDLFEKYSNNPYSVAWIDCFASGNQLGRGLFMVGDFTKDECLIKKNKKTINLPFYFPSWVLNKITVKIFNFLYFNKNIKNYKIEHIDYEKFFFPLDSIKGWNKMYGKKGFIQYQFILPLEHSKIGLVKILEKIVESKKGSFLAVLKLYGENNENYLSFPLKGYSLALDFSMSKTVLDLLDELDKIVISYGGRIYLAKDSRIKKENFEKGYSAIEKFRKIREKINAKAKFTSYQSERLGL